MVLKYYNSSNITIAYAKSTDYKEGKLACVVIDMDNQVTQLYRKLQTEKKCSDLVHHSVFMGSRKEEGLPETLDVGAKA